MPAAALPPLKVEIILEPKLNIPPAALRRLRAAARMAFRHLPVKLQRRASLTVLMAQNESVRRLNRDFRGMDKPTNVLSFPQMTPREIGRNAGAFQPVYLGDIAIAYPYVVEEAKKNNKILINHLQHLMIHGLLHLFGYDHIYDKDAVRMERLETKAMAALGLPDPYVMAQSKEPLRVRPARKRRRAAGAPRR